jgi:hypothetical protein
MKLILENWRKYQKDILNEIPLADFGYDEEHGGTDWTDEEDAKRRGVSRRSSVGYIKSKSKAYKDQAIQFFDKTQSNWYVIFLKDLRDHKGLTFGPMGRNPWIEDKVKKMQKDNNWDPKGKYIVVGFRPQTGDDDSVGWQLAHDIIGHTIDTWFEDNGVKDMIDDQVATKFKGVVFGDAIMSIHRNLPEEFQQATIDDVDDMMPDILAALFFDKGPDITSISSPGRSYLTLLEETVEEFKQEIEEGDIVVFGGWESSS